MVGGGPGLGSASRGKLHAVTASRRAAAPGYCASGTYRKALALPTCTIPRAIWRAPKAREGHQERPIRSLNSGLRKGPVVTKQVGLQLQTGTVYNLTHNAFPARKCVTEVTAYIRIIYNLYI